MSRKYPIPGHPRWVGYYRAQRWEVRPGVVRILPMVHLHRRRAALWRAWRRLAAVALDLWRSLYEIKQQEEEQHVRVQ